MSALGLVEGNFLKRPCPTVAWMALLTLRSVGPYSLELARGSSLGQSLEPTRQFHLQAKHFALQPIAFQGMVISFKPFLLCSAKTTQHVKAFAFEGARSFAGQGSSYSLQPVTPAAWEQEYCETQLRWSRAVAKKKGARPTRLIGGYIDGLYCFAVPELVLSVPCGSSRVWLCIQVAERSSVGREAFRTSALHNLQMCKRPVTRPFSSTTPHWTLIPASSPRPPRRALPSRL